MAEDRIRIDPRIFISPPYHTCPACKQETFGVLSIGNNVYTRRCRECWHSQTFGLPELQKKVIYLDQFVISEMMKAVNRKLGKADKTDSFWSALFEKLGRLSQLQLIVCPDSHFHQQESLLHEYKSLKRMYEHFSHGATFYDPATIRRFQVCQRFRESIGIKDGHRDLTASDVIYGDIDQWQEQYLISVEHTHTDDEIQAIRSNRDTVHDAIQEVFQRWQQEPNKKYLNWFEEEGMAWGRTMVQRYIDSIMKLKKYEHGQATMEEVATSVFGDDSLLITSLSQYLPQSPDQYGENLKTICSFLTSKEMLEVPFNRIGALIWAAIAEQAARDATRKAPNRGMVSDIDMVSTLLPYCDAMFVDRGMQGLLEYGPLKANLGQSYQTEIFSAARKEEFLEYLDSIERDADQFVIKMAIGIYGEPRPYFTMYDHQE